MEYSQIFLFILVLKVASNLFKWFRLGVTMIRRYLSFCEGHDGYHYTNSYDCRWQWTFAKRKANQRWSQKYVLYEELSFWKCVFIALIMALWCFLFSLMATTRFNPLVIVYVVLNIPNYYCTLLLLTYTWYLLYSYAYVYCIISTKNQSFHNHHQQ